MVPRIFQRLGLCILRFIPILHSPKHQEPLARLPDLSKPMDHRDQRRSLIMVEIRHISFIGTSKGWA